LFLDEVAELSVSAQAKLLQLLQNKEYYPLGASRSRKADVRIMAATNADLQERIASKAFREDLYYRLQVITLRMPNLRQRFEDLELLAVHLCEKACRQHGLRELTLSPGALTALRAREWPGNVRELEHVVEAGALRAAMQNVGQLEAHHLFADAQVDGSDSGQRTFQEETRRFQRELLCRVLIETDWNITETARRLDLARAHVYNLIKSFGISREQLGR
jgi:DNA-binding NtrC family response regulator